MHISWIILTRKFAFKIKKPLTLTFLDFSTPSLRKEYCERELVLNRRFSTIYLSVLPVRHEDNQWSISGPDDAFVVDHCVVMKRMAESKRMDRVIVSRPVNEELILALAKEIASFHNKAERIFTPFCLPEAQAEFNDIESVLGDVIPLGVQFPEIIKRAVDWSDSFLTKHAGRMQQRIDHGLRRDLHGDLHCGNIFLYRTPVLFDCIEFNDRFRQIDVLYEIAFLCMDLEALHKKHLAEVFVNAYRLHFPVFQQREDHDLFLYFKCLRANIRAKVHAIQIRQADTADERGHQVRETTRYLRLMNTYMADLRSVLFV
jgi:aminoglycoside phosphotransferase family enzyme